MSNSKPSNIRLIAPARWVLLSLTFFPVVGFAQNQSAPDNSGANKSQNQNKTADQQKDNSSDRQISAKIRRAVVGDKSLSTYGHNVKIIVAGGAVTLKGPVHSEEEKQKVAAKASEIVGQDKVTNQITIKQ